MQRNPVSKKKSVSHMSSVNQTFVSRTPVKGLLGDRVIPSLEQGCKVCLEFLVRLDRRIKPKDVTERVHDPA